LLHEPDSEAVRHPCAIGQERSVSSAMSVKAAVLASVALLIAVAMSPLSRNPRARDRQLANLAPRPPAPPPGNQRRRTHGGYATIARERLDAKAREVFEAISEDAPLRVQTAGCLRPMRWPFGCWPSA
jgi:hypothetical protein